MAFCRISGWYMQFYGGTLLILLLKINLGSEAYLFQVYISKHISIDVQYKRAIIGRILLANVAVTAHSFVLCMIFWSYWLTGQYFVVKPIIARLFVGLDHHTDQHRVLYILLEISHVWCVLWCFRTGKLCWYPSLLRHWRLHFLGLHNCQ